MGGMIRILAITILVLGLAGVVLGGVFVGFGMSRDNELKQAMEQEKVTLGIVSPELSSEIIDSLGEAQSAAETIREHRGGVAPSYQDLLGDKRFDPTNPQHLTYAQAMNLENNLTSRWLLLV